MIFKTIDKAVAVRLEDIASASVESHANQDRGWWVTLVLRRVSWVDHLEFATEKEAMAALSIIDLSFGEPVVIYADDPKRNM